jgi:C4-type Zn-finger protein
MKPTCPQIDRLYLLAEDGIAESEVSQIQSHVTTCPSCRQALETLDELKQIAWTLANVRLNSRDHERIDRCKHRMREALEQEGSAPGGSLPPGPNPGSR